MVKYKKQDFKGKKLIDIKKHRFDKFFIGGKMFFVN